MSTWPFYIIQIAVTFSALHIQIVLWKLINIYDSTFENINTMFDKNINTTLSSCEEDLKYLKFCVVKEKNATLSLFAWMWNVLKCIQTEILPT